MSRIIGAAIPRIDAREKVTGSARFLSDLKFPGMWVGHIVTSPKPHGIIRSVEVPEVGHEAGIVITHKDIPGTNQIGIVQKDQEFLAIGRVRSMAERIALIAARDQFTAERIKQDIRIEIEPLPLVDDPLYSLDSQAPQIHASGNLVARLSVRRGDIEEICGTADVIVEGTYRTGYQEHAYLETQGAICVPEGNGRYTIYSTCQCPFYVRSAVAGILGIPQSKIRVKQTYTGGAFGGKEDYPSEVAACAALLAFHTNKPVKIVFSRAEDFTFSTKRHRTVIHHTLAAMADGTMRGMKADIIFDAGPYSGLSVVVAERGNSSVCGPYELDAVDVTTRVVYTNNLFTGAFRGFGAPQVTFATERQIDELARRVNMDPQQIREKNLWKRGSKTASGERLNEYVAMRQTFRQALRLSSYRRRKRQYRVGQKSDSILRGIGISTSYYGNNLHKGGERLDRSQAFVSIQDDGSVTVSVGLTEMGQGLLTAVAQIVAGELGIDVAKVEVMHVDTDKIQDCGPTVASRGTIMSGMPARRAARTLKRRILKTIANRFDAKNLVIENDRIIDRKSDTVLLDWDQGIALCYAERVEMAALGFHVPPEKPYDSATGQGKPYAVNSYSTHMAEVEIDTGTGLVRVSRICAVHDIGRAINRQGVRGQIEGGIAQGAGLALWEELVTSDGHLLTDGFTDYAVPGMGEIPEISFELVEHPWSGGPFGAKGIGEPSLIGVPAAIANAVSDALGKPVYEIPLTPERVLSLIDDNSVSS